MHPYMDDIVEINIAITNAFYSRILEGQTIKLYELYELLDL